MTTKPVGLLSPGDMGHSVGRVLIENGMPVVTCLKGRSERTRKLAEVTGIKDLGTYEKLVRETDIILSILVPAEAESAAGKVAEALSIIDSQIVYVDCNAVSPKTVQGIGKIIEDAGSQFVDAGIIGPPPRDPGVTRFYASGSEASRFAALNAYGLDIRVIGQNIGQASGLKMTYAALTKGSFAIAIELLVAAWRMGLYEPLKEEFLMSQAQRYTHLENSLPKIPPKSRRWIGEMEEIAKTFRDLDMTPKIYQGAADIYRFMGKSSLADETPETLDENRSLEEVIRILAENTEGVSKE